jgi:hypothetical protein
MYDHVIWPEQFHRKIPAIYGLNDIDVEVASHRLSAAEIPASYTATNRSRWKPWATRRRRTTAPRPNHYSRRRARTPTLLFK